MLDVTKKYITDKKIKCSTCGLAELCIPQGLTKAELENLDSVGKAKRRMERGDILFHAFEKRTSIYAVSTGSYKTLIIDNQGHEQITGFYLPGDIVGLDGLSGVVPDSMAVAIESSTVCEIPEAEFNELCGNNVGLNHSFMCILRREIMREQQHVMTLAQMSADMRVAGFLIDFSRRFEDRGFSATEFNINMSRHDIANYLALAAETLSRIFGKLQSEGYLKVDRHNIRILDMDGLRRLAGATSLKRNT